MQTVSRVVFNTIILYAKILVTMAISLVSVPLVLKALGASDYGLYNLVAGVIAMLSFLNNSMTVSTQRFMSVAMGEKDEHKVNVIYNTSFVLHLFLGVIVLSVFEIIGMFAFDKLNIELERVWVAEIIYQFLVLSTFAKIIAVPFDAIMNAHEDMLAFSIIEIIDSLLMLAIAITLPIAPLDKLIYYGGCVSIIGILTLLMKYGWCRYAYVKNSIKPLFFRSELRIKEMLGFTGWNLFGAVAMIGRNQGTAIIINHFLGTIANAAYGVSNQINGALSHFSSTFQRAINPQLMKSEGMNDRGRLIRISFISSKFSVLAMSLLAFPLIIEMEEVLHLWLGNSIPPFTLRLSQTILAMSIAYQYSVGLMSAIQATGKIRNYQITMGLIILLNIPIAYVLLKLGYPIYYVTAVFAVLEVLSLVVRLFMAKKLIGMRISDYIKNVIQPTAIIIVSSTSVCLAIHCVLSQGFFRLFLSCLSYGLIYLIMMWFVALDANQRNGVKVRLNMKVNRMK